MHKTYAPSASAARQPGRVDSQPVAAAIDAVQRCTPRLPSSRLGAAAVPLAALFLAACSSAPSVETPETKQEVAQLNSGWQAERAKYMECVQEKADTGAKGKGTSRDVAAGALDACKGQLTVMHDAFQSYLSAQMSSAHGQNSARQAADRVTTDTREKARTYLTRYVEVERYKAGQR
ncbi:hypothetical protein [Cupriavidus sp. DL-D2]|uniref:hypothetical protein n=1 Tax=unclassified Cupriavidus TaxID=2640874 RepID=UPI003215B1ED